MGTQWSKNWLTEPAHIWSVQQFFLLIILETNSGKRGCHGGMDGIQCVDAQLYWGSKREREREIYIFVYIPVVPHKTVAELSKISNLSERLLVLKHEWQSEHTEGSKGGWSVGLIYLSVCLSTCLPVYLSIYLSVQLSVFLSIYLSVCLAIYLSVFLSVYRSVYLHVFLCICLSICLILRLCTSLYVSVYLSFHLSIYLSICLFVYLSIYPSIYRSIDLSIYLCLSIPIYTYLSIHPSIFLSSVSVRTKQFCKTSPRFSMDNIKNQALLQEFPGFSNLTTSKTKKFYEISSIFKVC